MAAWGLSLAGLALRDGMPAARWLRRGEQQFLAARNWPFGAALAMLVMTAVLLLFFYVRYETRRGDDAPILR